MPFVGGTPTERHVYAMYIYFKSLTHNSSKVINFRFIKLQKNVFDQKEPCFKIFVCSFCFEMSRYKLIRPPKYRMDLLLEKQPTPTRVYMMSTIHNLSRIIPYSVYQVWCTLVVDHLRPFLLNYLRNINFCLTNSKRLINITPSGPFTSLV